MIFFLTLQLHFIDGFVVLEAIHSIELSKVDLRERDGIRNGHMLNGWEVVVFHIVLPAHLNGTTLNTIEQPII